MSSMGLLKSITSIIYIQPDLTGEHKVEVSKTFETQSWIAILHGGKRYASSAVKCSEPLTETPF